MLASVNPMHIPDGFLSILVSLVLWIASAGIVGFALRRVGKDLGERFMPLMGVLGAAIFAGQMLNFTVAGGTSGHLMGAAVAAILLGPWAAVLVMTTVVGIQALIFQDGGLLALGANIFNMAGVGVVVAYAAFRTVLKLSSSRSWGLLVGGFLAAWLSVEMTALSVALQLALSGTSPASLAIPAMAGVHALIGIGEGLITLGVLAFIRLSRPDLLTQSQSHQVGGAALWVVGLVFAIVLAVLSPLASANPDGLERVAGQAGFVDQAREPLFKIIPDYLVPGIGSGALATILAGIIGVLLVIAVALGAAFSRRRSHKPPDSSPSSGG